MFLRAIFLVLAVAVVCSSNTVADESTPRYVHARDVIKQGLSIVTELSAMTTNSDFALGSPKRDYAIYLGVLDVLSEYFSRGCPTVSYDRVYEHIVNVSVPYAWSRPANVVGTVQMLLSITYETILGIFDLIDTYCPGSRVGVNEDECDSVINLQILLHPEKYRAGADLFLASANLAEVYLGQLNQEVAQRHDIISFLISAKDKLRNLVKRIVIFKRLLYGTANECVN
ncbi:hypothetical protein ACJJTC_019698 [Scirpophaga incertulas]